MLKTSEGKPTLNGLMPGKDGKLPKMSESKKPMGSEAKPAEGGSDHSELHDHGDGTFHTVKGGQQEEHPDMGHALMGLAGHHKPEGKHVHAHHDGMSVHSHGISGGVHDGPNEHGSAEEATQHMGNYLSEGENSEQPEQAQDHEGLSGFGG